MIVVFEKKKNYTLKIEEITILKYMIENTHPETLEVFLFILRSLIWNAPSSRIVRPKRRCAWKKWKRYYNI